MEHVILGFLNRQPMSGYDLRKKMLYSTGMFYDASFGTIYPTLKKLEKKGFVLSKKVQKKRKTLLIYTITTTGQEELDTWLKQPSMQLKIRYEFLAKIFFADAMKPEELIQLMDEHIHQLEDTQNMIAQLEQQKSPNTSIYQEYTIQFAKDFYTFLAEWHTKTKKELETKGEQNNAVY